jgi:hypothetical protein
MYRASLDICDYRDGALALREGTVRDTWYAYGCVSETLLEALPFPLPLRIPELEQALEKLGLKRDNNWSPARVTCLNEIVVVTYGAHGSITAESYIVEPVAKLSSRLDSLDGSVAHVDG